MKWKNKSVLITGISGFTGKHLSSTLIQKGAIVHGFASSFPENFSEFVNGEKFIGKLQDKSPLNQAVQVSNPDYVIHLAGISFTNHSSILPYYDVNVIGTDNLLDACKEYGTKIKKIILASSAAIYGIPKNDYVRETDIPSPISHYGNSKLAMEHSARTKQGELPIILVRPFNYTGIGQPKHFIIPKIVTHFADKKSEIELGNTNVLREFSDVRDIVDQYIALLTSKNTGTFNLCTGKTNSIQSVIDTLTEITGHQIKVQTNPEFVRPNDIPRLIGSTEKLISVTGKKPYTPLSVTLSTMFNAISSN